MNVFVLQHVPFVGLGIMEKLLDERHAKISYVKFFKSDVQLPELDEVDMVIAMGGPMSINDEKTYPWLVEEKSFIRAAISKQIPVLGICLGAQLIASTYGAEVRKNANTEIGWFPIKGIYQGAEKLSFPNEQTVLHWHGETFMMPDRGSLLAFSEACLNQAFQVGTNVIGLQFHPEMTREALQTLLDECADELVPGPYVQTEASLLDVPEEWFTNSHKLMKEVLSYLLDSKGQHTNAA
jgi:GMP synthase-like glutamine amidotransferase